MATGQADCITPAECWDPNAIKPRQLYRSPNLSLLCAKRVEGQFYERKSKREPARLAETICAFANAPANKEHGGLLAVGICDDGTIEGVRHPGDLSLRRLLEYHHYAGTRSEHRFVDCVNKHGRPDQLLLIYVPYLEGRVAETSKGKAYVRRGDETVELRDPERRELEYSKGQISFEDEPVCEYSADLVVGEILDELRKSVVTADKASPDLAMDQMLLSKHLLRKQEGKVFLTKAGLLLLGKDPCAHLPGAYVRFLRYQGTEKKAGASHNAVKDEMFRDPLPRLLQRLRDFLRSQLREFSFLASDGRFVQEPEYPDFVWQEALVNALVHRSYSLLNMPVLIEMYDDRIEVTSPGDYPPGVHPREFIHNPCNPHLMEAMRYLRFVRMVSEGSLRMRQEMGKANLPQPEFSLPGNPRVRVVLRNDIERRVKQRTGEGIQASEHANLFRITWTEAEPGNAGVGDGTWPPEEGEIREALRQALRARGYAVDSFFGDTAIDPRQELVPELRDSGIASVRQGFTFQVMRLRDGAYLLLDHTVQVSNRARLDRIMAISPAMAKRGFHRGFVREGEEWAPCRIRGVTADGKVLIESWAERGRTSQVATENVIPALSSSGVAELLERAGAKVDLHKAVKRLSFSLCQNAARERSRQTEEIAGTLSKNVFPLRIRGYRLHLDPTPRRLTPPVLALRNDLTDPEPVFSKEVEGRAPKVLNGLSTYGSYEKPEREVPLVLLCTRAVLDDARGLIDALRRGSAKYRGLEKTFAISFAEPIVAAVDSPDDYEDKCKQLCASVPPESFFLVYCPERGYSRADYDAPYYRVKHFLLEAGFPSQMVDEETIKNPKWKDFNLALDIFAKAGHVPWVLAEGLPDADLFLGLSYSSIRGNEGAKRLIGYVNVFDRYGKWLYYRGNTRPIRFEERNLVFAQLLAEVAQEYEKKAKLQRLHVHHSFRLSHEGRQEIASGVMRVSPEAEVSFVHMNKHSSIRLYDSKPEGDGTLRRGAYVQTAPNRFYMSTTGQNEYDQRGMGTPRPLDVTVSRVRSRGELDVRVYAQHVLSLTRLNWASVKDFCREPITIKFASDIAYLMNVFLSNYGRFTLHPRLENTPWFL